MLITIQDIDIEVTRKNIKNINLRISSTDGVVRISAPKRIDEETIRAFALSKLAWIRKHRSIRMPISEPLIVTGESVYLWDNEYRLNVIKGVSNSIKIKDEEVILTFNKDYSIEQRIKLMNNWYKDLLQAELIELIDKWHAITGLRCSSWQIRNMKSKWGTCNTKTKKLWFSLQLIKKPIDCLEYVVVHELMHLKEKGHGRAFKELMDRYYPLWKSIRKKLKQ